jgi:hypothetical protein
MTGGKVASQRVGGGGREVKGERFRGRKSNEALEGRGEA